MLFTGREVRIGKNCAHGLAVVKIEDTIFPYMDQPRQVKNIFFSTFASLQVNLKRLAECA